MATVRIPSSVALRKTRIAISERLATSSFLKVGMGNSADETKTTTILALCTGAEPTRGRERSAARIAEHSATAADYPLPPRAGDSQCNNRNLRIGAACIFRAIATAFPMHGLTVACVHRFRPRFRRPPFREVHRGWTDVARSNVLEFRPSPWRAVVFNRSGLQKSSGQSPCNHQT